MARFGRPRLRERQRLVVQATAGSSGARQGGCREAWLRHRAARRSPAAVGAGGV